MWEGGELERKYKIECKGLNVVIEEWDQKINATSMKLKLYENRSEQYIKNRMFQTFCNIECSRYIGRKVRKS